MNNSINPNTGKNNKSTENISHISLTPYFESSEIDNLESDLKKNVIYHIT